MPVIHHAMSPSVELAGLEFLPCSRTFGPGQLRLPKECENFGDKTGHCKNAIPIYNLLTITGCKRPHFGEMNAPLL
jgi:hypothetical protein